MRVRTPTEIAGLKRLEHLYHFWRRPENREVASRCGEFAEAVDTLYRVASRLQGYVTPRFWATINRCASDIDQDGVEYAVQYHITESWKDTREPDRGCWVMFGDKMIDALSPPE